MPPVQKNVHGGYNLSDVQNRIKAVAIEKAKQEVKTEPVFVYLRATQAYNTTASKLFFMDRTGQGQGELNRIG